MSSKIDIRRVFTEHLATLRRQGSDDTSWPDIATFYGVPAVVAIFYFFSTDKLKPEAVTQIDSVLVAAFSIFAALLLNVQVLIIGLRDKMNARISTKFTDQTTMSPEDIKFSERLTSTKSEEISELFCNVSYAIFTSIAVVAFTLLAIFTCIEDSIIVKSLQFFAVTHFCLTGIMILKRMHVIFSSE